MGLTARANVRLTARDGTGRVVDERHVRNAFLHQYAHLLALPLAGGTPSLPLTHVSLGAAGRTIDALDSITGWTNSPILDQTRFAQGTASLRRSATASASVTMAGPAVSLDLATGFSPATDLIEFWVLVDLRARLDPAAEVVRFVTSPGNHFALTWASAEQYLGGAILDNTWTRVTVPMAAFTATGTPSWASITGVSLGVAANANGTVTVNWDDLRLVPATVLDDATRTVVQNEVSRLPFAARENLGSGRVRVRAFWNSGQAVGTFRLLGLHGNAGATLAALVAVSPPLVKTNLLTLTVEWTVILEGG